MNSTGRQSTVDAAPPRRRESLIERELPEELILYDPESDRAFLLNHTSAVIWDLCNGERSENQIAEQVAQDFGAPQAEVLQDVARTVARLRRDSLIV